eukprot:TRINITY_DN4758_c0_g2_i1.p1 TRINITY_DN4758_c0_g2~~TRINITY_DN4758_c0_g2_i1.p1  ORF type:complete len:742 (-),score=122.18 TRINITY_DN4758_c0_g2_i1:192-2354(-)
MASGDASDLSEVLLPRGRASSGQSSNAESPGGRGKRSSIVRYGTSLLKQREDHMNTWLGAAEGTSASPSSGQSKKTQTTSPKKASEPSSPSREPSSPSRKSNFVGVKGSKVVSRENSVRLQRSHKKQSERAYMGQDWFKLQMGSGRFSMLFFTQHMYYWVYSTYIVGAILLGGVVLWALDSPDPAKRPVPMTLPQAIYSAGACVSQSGLAVLDWSKQSQSTYIVSFFLILFGSASLLHMAPVYLRLKSFKMQASYTMKMKKKTKPQSIAAGVVKTKRSSSDPCVQPVAGFHMAAPEAEESDKESAATDRADTSDEEDEAAKFSHYSDYLPEAYRLECRALEHVIRIMVGYWLVTHLIGITIFYLYFTMGSGKIVDHFLNDEHLRPHTHAIYLAVSSFQNNGLTMTPSSVMDFTLSPIILNTVGALIVCGNTGLPVMVRLIATVWYKCTKAGSDKERTLSFLLQHPRRCFTHMFPAVHTAWLLLVIVTLNTVCTAISVWQDYNSVAMKDLSFMNKVWNALFQSISSRTAGFNSVNIADLSQATTFLLAFMMYLATTPTVVTMRFSASRTELDITGRKEGIEEEVITGDNSIKSQARRYLSQDVFYLGAILFFILVFERDQFSASAARESPNTDGIYYDFSFFKVLFELISAYGTCGLSLGFRDQSASFSGVWSVPSQMLLTAAMVLGRLRGLPDSIDPCVRIGMTLEDEGRDAADHKFIKV